jgi:hypothetical protein
MSYTTIRGYQFRASRFRVSVLPQTHKIRVETNPRHRSVTRPNQVRPNHAAVRCAAHRCDFAVPI